MDHQPNTEKKPQMRGLWQPAFLTAFAQLGNVTEAAKLANTTRMTVWRHKTADPEFAKLFGLPVQLRETAASFRLHQAHESIPNVKGRDSGSDRPGMPRELSDSVVAG